MFGFRKKSVPEISVDKLKNILGIEKCFLIDVREPHEFTEGHIETAINIPLGELGEKVAAVVPDKSAHIYVNCRSGVRSAKATQKLLDMGYANTKNVEGGILAWESAEFSGNHPIITLLLSSLSQFSYVPLKP